MRNTTLKWFVGMISLFVLGLAYAAPITVPVPNTFTSGTTISSSAMNANFTAVTNQMPGVNEVGISHSSFAVTTSFANVATVSITAPTAGYVVVRFDGNAYVPVSGNFINLAASDTSNALGSIGAGDQIVHIVPETASLTLPFSHTRVYPVTAGAHSYYAVVAGTAGTDKIYGTLTVEFFPNSN